MYRMRSTVRTTRKRTGRFDRLVEAIRTPYCARQCSPAWNSLPIVPNQFEVYAIVQTKAEQIGLLHWTLTKFCITNCVVKAFLVGDQSTSGILPILVMKQTGWNLMGHLIKGSRRFTVMSDDVWVVSNCSSRCSSRDALLLIEFPYSFIRKMAHFCDLRNPISSALKVSRCSVESVKFTLLIYPGVFQR